MRLLRRRIVSLFAAVLICLVMYGGTINVVRCVWSFFLALAASTDQSCSGVEDEHPKLIEDLKVLLESLFQHTSSSIALHVICDDDGWKSANEVIANCQLCQDKKLIRMVEKHKIKDLVSSYPELVSVLRKKFTKEGSYYGDDLFVITPFLHLLPIDKIIILDVDLKFRADVRDLWSEFEKFLPSSVIGVAPELSPVYYHYTHQYRKENPLTKVGSTEPKHMQGINSGVMLLDLEKIRSQPELLLLQLDPLEVERLHRKYDIWGGLGDQDLVTLLSFEHPDLFHFLSCGWNRALCLWWKRVYPELFEEWNKNKKPSMEGRRELQMVAAACLKMADEGQVPEEALHHLVEVVDSLLSSDVSQIQEMLVLPFSIVIAKPQMKEKTRVLALEGLKKIFQKSVPYKCKWSAISDIFSLLFRRLSDREQLQLVSEVSEEVKIATVECCEAMLFHAPVMSIADLYEPSFSHRLAHGIFVLLQLIQKEQYSNLRLESLKCLRTVMGLDRVEEFTKIKIAKSLAEFLPGVSIAMEKVINADHKQHHAVAELALVTWGEMVSLVMQDSIVKKLDKGQSWVLDTGTKLRILIERMKGLEVHPHRLVRLALVSFSARLLVQCRESLQNCTSTLVDILVTLSSDSWMEVQEEARKQLHDASTIVGEVKDFQEILEDRLFDISSHLHWSLLSGNDEMKLREIRLLGGYLELLGLSVNKVLNSSAHLHQMTQSLVNLAELVPQGLAIVETAQHDQKWSDTGGSGTPFSSWRQFKHFHNQIVWEELQRVCHLLGAYGDLFILLDCFLAIMREEKHARRKEAILILNQIIAGQRKEFLQNCKAEGMRKEDLRGLIKNLSVEYVDRSVLGPLTESSPLASQASHSLQTVLLLEGLGYHSEVLEEDYQPVLVRVLCPILEKAASPVSMVSEAGLACLQRIAHSTGCSGIPDLIGRNVDYFAHQACIRMRKVDRYPEAPAIVRVVLQYAQFKVLPLVVEIVNEAMQSLDLHQEKATLYIQVFRSYVTWLANCEQAVNRELLPSSPTPCAPSARKSLAEILSERITAHRIAKLEAQEEERTFEEVQDASDVPEEEQLFENAEDIEKKTPEHLQLVSNAMEKCSHLLTLGGRDERLTLTACETVRGGLHVLASHEDDLLPAVHKEGAIKLYTYLGKLAPNAIWLILSDIWCHQSQLLHHQSPSTFPPILLCGSTEEGSDFAQNISAILQTLHGQS
ncbi:unnamed protein product [Darwinula stevensoni]|uniref:Uncharacterized protein n=1 Tax=Darwinula stevensoni TaxID=69355 RepID=A0A7R9A533_9CRUS|nr:unnamed protein product [Darwinula stevensoni]CAG0885581.1 unnamed protein product [Darwinula stevensoni]